LLIINVLIDAMKTRTCEGLLIYFND